MNQKISIFYTTSKKFLMMSSLILCCASKAMEIPLTGVIKSIGYVKPIREFRVSDAHIMSLALSPNEDFIVAGSSNSSGGKKLWGVSLWQNNWNNTELNEATFDEHKLNIPITVDYSTQTLAISDNNKFIMGQSDDHIWKWDIENKKLIGFDSSNFLPIDNNPRIERTIFIPTKNEIIVNQDLRSGLPFFRKYTSAKIFDLSSGELLRTLHGASGHVVDLAINPEGTRVVAILHGGSVVMWDSETAGIVKDLKIKTAYTAIDMSKQYIATYNTNDELKLMDLNFQEIKNWKVPLIVEQLKITPDENYIIFRNKYEGLLGIIDIKSEKVIRFKISDRDDNAEWPSTFIIDKNSKYIIVGNDNGMVKVFDIKAILEAKPIEKPVLDLNMLKNSLMQLTATLGSLASK